MKKQPLVAPLDVKRYFVSPDESGQICMLSCILGKNKEIFFPKLGEEQMLTFAQICDDFLHSLGYEVKRCETDEEAKRYAAEMSVNDRTYPVVYFASDTTGEKSFEEFYIPGEKLNMERFESLGVIEEVKARPINDIDNLFFELKNVFAKDVFSKEEIVEVMKRFIPNFEHIERGKNLDQKM